MRKAMLVLAGAFGAALALVLGLRLETAGLSVVAGVLLGIVAGLPVNGVLLYLFWRERQERERLEERRREEVCRPAAPAPPVVILQSGRPVDPALPAPRRQGVAEEREFVIVGEED